MEFPHIEVIKDYLKQEFPDSDIEDEEDFDFHARTFKVTDGDRIHILKVSFDFASDTDAAGMKKLLNDEDIASHMRNPKYTSVMISNDGMLVKLI